MTKPYISGPTAKICGLISPEDIHYAAHAGIAAGIKMQAGFLYGVEGGNPADFKKMDGGLELLKKRVREAQGKGMEAVIVTDMTAYSDFKDLLQQVRPVTLQLCGDIDAKTVSLIRANYGDDVKLIKAIHVGSDAGAAMSTAIKWNNNPNIDALLLDSCNGGNTKGGTGKKHDWSISARIMAALTKPCGLAGGLNPDNVGDAIEQVGPSWVDVDTGTRKRLAEGIVLTAANYRRDVDACIAFAQNAAISLHMIFAPLSGHNAATGLRQARQCTS